MQSERDAIAVFNEFLYEKPILVGLLFSNVLIKRLHYKRLSDGTTHQKQCLRYENITFV